MISIVMTRSSVFLLLFSLLLNAGLRSIYGYHLEDDGVEQNRMMPPTITSSNKADAASDSIKPLTVDVLSINSNNNNDKVLTMPSAKLQAISKMGNRIQMVQSLKHDLSDDAFGQKIEVMKTLRQDITDMGHLLEDSILTILSSSSTITTTVTSTKDDEDDKGELQRISEEATQMLEVTKPFIESAMVEIEGVLSYMNLYYNDYQRIMGGEKKAKVEASVQQDASSSSTTTTQELEDYQDDILLSSSSSLILSPPITDQRRKQSRRRVNEEREGGGGGNKRSDHFHYHQQGRWNPYKASSILGHQSNQGGSFSSSSPFTATLHSAAGRRLGFLKKNDFDRRRRMEEGWGDQCLLLKNCVEKMSIYDLFVYFHSDDIDDTDGSLDSTIRTYDESDIYAKFVQIKSLVSGLDTNDFDACSNLLQEFHRNIEQGSIDNWEGASISQVCFAEGTSRFVKLNDIASVSTLVAGEVFQDSIRCARMLWESNDRKAYSNDEEFVFEESSNTLRYPIGYDRSASGLDQHGHMVDPTTYPFIYETIVYSTIDSSGGYDKFNSGFCNGSCGRDKELQCQKQIASCYYEIYKASSLGETPCYPDYVIEGIDIDGDCPGIGCEARYNYVQKLDPDHTACYNPAMEISACQQECSGWHEYQIDRAIDSKSNTPPCRQGKDSKCIAATMPTGSTLFSGEDFEKLDTAIELVFGERSSVGLICSIAGSVADDDMNLPGRCCLDAPYQSRAPWGQPYTCESNCENPGPYFGGIDTVTCDAYGGTWCANPQDCTGLRDCVAEYEAEAEEQGGMAGYLEYLRNYPTIDDPTDPNQCGAAKEYFGFDRDILDDEYICENVYQLRLTNDFDFLNEFFEQGGTKNERLCGGEGEEFSADCYLDEPTQPDDLPKVLFKGKQWRSTNFALGQISEGIADLIGLNGDLECPSTIGVSAVCVGFKNIMILVLYIIYIALRLSCDISEHAYGEYAELGNVEPREIYENTLVLYDNMVKSLDKMVSEMDYHSEKIVGDLTTPVRTYVTGAKFAGCDGIDQNFDNIVDECEEDQYPPSIKVPRSGDGKSLFHPCGKDFAFRYKNIEGTKTDDAMVFQHKSGEPQFCLDHKSGTFESVNDAMAFLEMNLDIEDDCASDEHLYLQFEVEGTCYDTKFTVTPIHYQDTHVEHCNEFTSKGHPLEFILGVDGSIPTIDAGFDTDYEVSDDGKTVFIEEDSNSGLVDTGFYFEVRDDCPGSVEVTVDISQNEYVQGTETLAMSYNGKLTEAVTEVNLYVLPKSCASGTLEGAICTVDPCSPFKYFEIDLTVVDVAGNTSKDKLFIVIRPRREIQMDPQCIQRRKLRQHRQKEKRRNLRSETSHGEDFATLPNGENKFGTRNVRSRQTTDPVFEGENEGTTRDLKSKKKKKKKKTLSPTLEPSSRPSVRPSESPSSLPSSAPSSTPSTAPSTTPSTAPSILPTVGASGIAAFISESTSKFPTLQPITFPAPIEVWPE